MAIVLDQRDCITLSFSRLNCAPEFAGVPIQLGLSGSLFDPLTPALDAINSLIGSLGPLKPLIDVLALVVQIVKCIQAIPESILTLNPTELINCVPRLAELVAVVLSHIPPFSLFRIVAGFLCLVISFLEAIEALLVWIRNSAVDLNFAFSQNLELKDINLSAIISCGNANLNGLLDELGGLFDLISVLIAVYNLFAELAQLDPIELPDLGLSGSAGVTLEPTFLDPAIEVLQTTTDTLMAVLQVIPTGLSMV